MADSTSDALESASVGTLTARERRRLTRVHSDNAILAVLAFSGLIAAFMQTIVIPIAPELPRLLNASSADATWVLSSTLLAMAVSTPISGRLGDMYGKRRMVIVLMVAVVIGSVIAALSTDIVPMIVGRTLQGFGLGVIPLGVSILRDVLHPKNLGAAVALVSATLGIGGSLGLPIAASIAQTLDWHVLFWAAAVLGALALVLVVWIVPPSTLRSGGRFDLIGALGFALGLVAILLAVSKGNEWGWGSALVVALFVSGAVILILWGVFELRVRDPLVDLRVAVRRPVLFANLASITVGFAFFGSQAVLPQLIVAPSDTGVGFGQTLLVASLCLMPTGVIMFLMSSVAARFSARTSPRWSVALGCVIVTVAYVVAMFAMSEIWQILVIATLLGFGVAFAYAAIPLLIMRSVPSTETAAANGLNAVMRSLGSTLASAILGLLLASSAVPIGDHAVPSADAFQLCFAIAACATIFGALAALCIPRRAAGYNTSSLPTIPTEDHS